MQPASPALTNFMAAVGGTSGGFRPTMVAEGLQGEEGLVGEPGGCVRTGLHVRVLFGGGGDDVPWWLLVALLNPKNHILRSLPGKLRHGTCSARDHQCPPFPIPPQP